MARKSIEGDPEWVRLREAEEAAWELYAAAQGATAAYEREWKP